MRNYLAEKFLKKQSNVSLGQEEQVLWEITNPSGCCCKWKTDPLQWSLSNVLECFSYLYHNKKLNYRTIGLHRSAISENISQTCYWQASWPTSFTVLSNVKGIQFRSTTDQICVCLRCASGDRHYYVSMGIYRYIV